MLDLTDAFASELKHRGYQRIMEIRRETSERDESFNKTTLSLVNDLATFKSMLSKNLSLIRGKEIVEDLADLEKMVNYLS